MKQKTAPTQLPTIILDSRPIYIVDEQRYDTYEEAVKHIIRDRIIALYDETGFGYDHSPYDISGWICDNFDKIAAIRAEVKTITATRKQEPDKSHPNVARWLAEGP